MSLALTLECWGSLAAAILFGVLGTITMKVSHGLTHTRPTISLAIFYTISFVAMTFAMKFLDLSVVYAVWSGIGTVLVAIVGMLYFGEAVSARKIFFLLLIVAGVMGIHFGDSFSEF